MAGREYWDERVIEKDCGVVKWKTNIKRRLSCPGVSENLKTGHTLGPKPLFKKYKDVVAEQEEQEQKRTGKKSRARVYKNGHRGYGGQTPANLSRAASRNNVERNGGDQDPRGGYGY